MLKEGVKRNKYRVNYYLTDLMREKLKEYSGRVVQNQTESTKEAIMRQIRFGYKVEPEMTAEKKKAVQITLTKRQFEDLQEAVKLNKSNQKEYLEGCVIALLEAQE